MARTQDGWGAEGISGRVKFLPLAWAGMPKTSFRKNSDSPQEGSERRVLMLMDEFESLKNFRIVEEGFNRGRGSMLKFWIILQNYGQLVDHYDNPANFTGNADMQVFGIAKTDSTLKNMIVDALGEYEDNNGVGHEDRKKENKKLMAKDAISSFLDGGKPQQIYIPLHGANMRLTRVDFRKLFRKKYYGGR